MVKLTIMNIEEKNYKFITDDKKEYEFNITFYDLESPLKVGDSILIHKELLDPNYIEYSKHYMFGPLDQPYGRKVLNEEHRDAIVIKSGDKTIMYKRFFG